MTVIMVDPGDKPQLTAEQIADLQKYADRIASVGGSLLANATLLRKIIATLQPADDDKPSS